MNVCPNVRVNPLPGFIKKLIPSLAVCSLPALGMAQSTNVLRNPGFEAEAAGKSLSFAGWTTFGPNYGPVVHTNVYSEGGNGVAHGGVSCLKVTPDLTTYNVNFNGVYQDYLSGPGATYAADGWVYAPSSNVLAGGNSAWLEVTFRDANANALALYRSAIVTNVAGGGFARNTWVDLPLTNACDPATLGVTGTVSQLVAPAGTYFVRYRVVVRGDGGGSGGWLYFDDLNLALAGAAPYGGWQLAWSDEFNGTSMDPHTWTYDIGTGPGQGWGNWEREYYTSNANNVYVAGGLLHVVAQQAPNYNGSSAAYTSARLKSQGLFSCKYGRIEWRAKLPVGLGCWPALWLLGTNITTIPWPACGEIDVMENRGSDPTFVQGTLHSGSDGGGVYQFIHGLEGDAASGFHSYSLDWATNMMMFSVDGHCYGMQTNWSSSAGAYPFPFNQPFFFIMNLAIGGGYLGYPSDSAINGGTKFPAEMDVDYLRIYQLTNAVIATVPPPPPPQQLTPASVLVDFESGDTNDITHSPDANGRYWNSALVSQSPNNAVPVNGSTQPMALVSAANAVSGISLTISNSGYAVSANPSWGDYRGAYGWPAAINSPDFPATALRDGMTIGGGGNATVTLSGLNTNSVYTLLTYGGTVQSFGSTTTDNGNSQTQTLTVGTSPSPASVRFNPFYNNSTVVVWSNVTPSASGEVAFTIAEPAGGSGGALNFLALIPSGIASTNPPSAPSGLHATGGNLSWKYRTAETQSRSKGNTG